MDPTAVSLRDMQRIMPILDEAEFAVLARGVLGVRTREQAESLPVAVQLRMLLWEWLVHLGFVTDGQRREIVRLPDLAHAACGLEGGPHDLPVRNLIVADHRYLGWSWCALWYDFVYGEELASLPEPAVTLIVCDLNALYLRSRKRLAQLRSPADAG